MTVYPFIEAEKRAGHSVKRACELMKVSRSAYYQRRQATPGPRARQDAELTSLISQVHTHSRGTYGAPGIHAALKGEGHTCGRRRIARLMRAAGLQGRHRRRGHRITVPDPAAATRPDLVMRDFTADLQAVDTRWCGDDHLGTSLVADALTTACHQRRPTGPVIFQSDGGSQYTSHEFARLATSLSIRLSVGRTGV
ncbi:IS3 family transposase [Streptomyces sp. NPDC057686]|uniref:IS3 family transposase n=1 Tax=Streptomyces sp. NPDC057686 TaxID=3346212 RepID=UPI003698BEB3